MEDDSNGLAEGLGRERGCGVDVVWMGGVYEGRVWWCYDYNTEEEKFTYFMFS